VPSYEISRFATLVLSDSFNYAARSPSTLTLIPPCANPTIAPNASDKMHRISHNLIIEFCLGIEPTRPSQCLITSIRPIMTKEKVQVPSDQKDRPHIPSNISSINITNNSLEKSK
jgi:hypothetical protein